jgi:hypothetical protein
LGRSQFEARLGDRLVRPPSQLISQAWSYVAVIPDTGGKREVQDRPQAENKIPSLKILKQNRARGVVSVVEGLPSKHKTEFKLQHSQKQFPSFRNPIETDSPQCWFPGVPSGSPLEASGEWNSAPCRCSV